MLKFTTLDSLAIAVLLLEPDYTSPIEIELTIPTVLDPGMDGQETRKAYGESLRYKMAYRGCIDGVPRKNFDVALNRLKNEKVAVPYWLEKSEVTGYTGTGLGQVHFADSPILTEASRFIIWNDQGDFLVLDSARETQTTTSAYVDLTDVADVPAGSDGKIWIAPMLFGRFVKRPEATAERDDLKEYAVEVQEQSAFSDRLVPRGTSAANVGAAIADFALTPLWPIRPNFTQPLDTTTIDTLLQQIGFLREPEEDFTDQFAKRGHSMMFSGETRLEAMTLMRMFLDRLGPVSRFWLPTFNEDQRLYGATNVAVSGVSIIPSDYASEFDRIGRHPGVPYICVLTDQHMIPLEVNEVATGDPAYHVLATETNVGETIAIDANPIISALLLARFAETTLKISFTSDAHWNSEVRFVECVEEYLGPDGTAGKVGYLYKFAMPATGLEWFFTSYEKALTLGAQVYAVGPFDHGSIKKSMNIEGETCDLISFKKAGNPLMLFIPSGLEAPMFVTIYKVDAEGPDGSEKIIFTGQIKNVKTAGPRLDVACVPIGSALEQKLPKFYIQRACNYDLYGTGTCRVDPDAHKVEGAIDTQDSDECTIDILSLTNSGDSRAAQYFANGWLEIGSGATKELRAVLRSDPIVGGQRLWINRPLASIAGTVAFWPGCDWQFTGGCLKFANQVNFGGFPELPEVNPSVEAVPMSPGAERRK